jgi:MerR HTH family regulatory protein
MQLMQTVDASRLAGLTPHQLREWCARRSIVAPDVPGSGRGRHALFSWQTVLTLRLLRELNDRFGVEVGAWKGALGEFRVLVGGRPFPGLWSMLVAFPDRDHARLVEDRAVAAGALLLLPLAPHLRAIAEDFAMPPDPQLPLFPAVGLRR